MVRLAEGFTGLPVIHPVVEPIVDVAVGAIVINVIFNAASRNDCKIARLKVCLLLRSNQML